MPFARRLRRPLVALALAVVSASPSVAAVPGPTVPGTWTGDFGLPSFDGPTFACAVFDGRYVVAGEFEWAGGTHAANVAVWNGASWDELGGGLDARVNRLAVWGDKLLAGTDGYFSISPVKQFDGEAWSPLGPALYGHTKALLVAGNTVYAAGRFYLVGETNGCRVLRWSGSDWQPVGGTFDSDVNALAVYGGELYAGGAFLNGDAGYVGGIARWDGAHWVGVGATSAGAGSHTVTALAVWRERLIAGGSFTSIDTVAARGVAAWNGSAWSALPGTPDDALVADLEPEGDLLHVAGVLQVRNQYAAGLVTFDGKQWSLPPTYPGWGVADIATGNNSLLAVGSHSYLVNGAPTKSYTNTRNVLVRDPEWRALEAWQPTMRGLRGPGWTQVQAMHVHSGSLFAGGYFQEAAHPPAWSGTNGIARWDGDGWAPLPGLTGWVQALASWNGILVAGGNGLGTMSNSSSVIGWNGDNWSLVGQRIEGTVNAFTVWEGALVAVGGLRDYIAGNVNHAAMINRGSGWTWLGNLSPVDGWSTLDVAVFAGDLYLAGRFQLPGVGPRSLLRWNGSAWVEVPGAQNLHVTCLRSRPDGLWMGQSQEYYPTGGGGGVLRWNGASWTDMGLSTFTVYKLAEMNGEVWACGSGYLEDGPATMALLRDGRWQGVANSPNGTIFAAAALGHDLFVGGRFTRAGGRAAEAVARWSPSPAGEMKPLVALSAGPNPATDYVLFRFALARAGQVRLTIHDLSGALVARPVDEYLEAGTTEREWRAPRGRGLRSGVYFAKLTTPDGEARRRLVFVK